jgi:predicted DNA-binding antitoxin AbrB/MazE fold protein
MLNEIEAIYEHGVFRPLAPVSLSEQERVKLTFSRDLEEGWLDTEFMNACEAEADPTITLQHVRDTMAKIHGTMDDAINADRGEF